MKIYRNEIIILDLGYIPNDATENRTLMQEHSVSFSVELGENIPFRKGDYIILREKFQLAKDVLPTVNENTGGFEYDFVFHHESERLKDYIFKYEGDPKFDLFASGDQFLTLIINQSGLNLLVGEFPIESRDITFENVDMFSALNMIAEEYQMEWWINNGLINLGKCEFGEPLNLTYDVEVKTISLSDSTERIITRLYAYGSDRNTGEALQIPPIDLYPDMPEDQVIEGVVQFDIFPKQNNKITSVETEILPETPDTQETYLYTIGADNSFTITPEVILPGKPLKISFLTGDLMGEDFELILRGDKFEIKFEEDNGVYTPNEFIKPDIGDEFFLYNIKAETIMPGMIQEAKDRLLIEATNFLEKTKHHYVYDISTHSIEASEKEIDLEIGQRVILSGPTTGVVKSRIQSYSKDLNNRFDATYQIGENPQYSRLADIEKTALDNKYKILRSAGLTSDQIRILIRTIGKSEFISKTGDDSAQGFIQFLKGISVEELATFSNGLTSEGLATFLKGISVEELATLTQGLEIGNFQSGMHAGQGGLIDSAGNAELESLVLRSFLEVPSIRYNELEYIGEEIIIGAGAVLKGVEHLGDDRYRLTLKLEDGQFNPFRPSDLLKGIYNMDEDGNFTGFGTTYVSVSSIEEHEMIVVLADESDVVANRNMPPRKFMHLARIGNFTDTDRQSYISLSAKDRAITQYGGVNAFAKKNKQGKNVRAGVVTTQWGRAEGLEFIENFDNLPITKDSDVLYTDTLLYNKQIKVDYEGIVIKEYIDRGQWFEGMECQVTETTIDEVWIEAEKFRLIDRPIENEPFSTSEMPTRGSDDWTLVLSIKDDIEDRYNDLKGELETYADTIGSGLQSQIDGVVDSWFYAYVPTNGNYPANEWTTNILKDRHIGDTFTNVEPFVNEATTPHAGKSWRWVKNGSTYKWTSIADSDAVKALLEASKAQDTADGKRRVFTTTPKATDTYDVGDLWVNATAGTYINDILRCKTAKAKGAAFNISHWEKASKYTDDTKANEAKQAADNAQDSANTANQAIGDLSDTVGELEIGLINDTTLNLLEEQLRTIKIERDNTINAYNVLDSNTYLTGTAKSTLTTRKNHFDSSVSAIVTALEDAIADGNLTQGELDIIHAALNGYNISYVAFQNAIEQARKVIEIEIDRIAKGYVDDIEIGGRNLIKGGFTNGHWNQASIGSNNDGRRGRTVEVISLEVGKEYSFSMKPETRVNTKGIWITFRNADNTYNSVIIRSVANFKFIAPAPLCTISYDASFATGYYGGDYFRDALPKLEKGNKPTDWTPAPEDTDAEIQLAKAIPYQAGEYKAGTPYVRDPNSYPIVSYGTSGGAPLYYALIGDVGTNKQPNLPANNTIWENVTSFKQVFTEVLFAEFAKLDSFVFNNGKMFSQEGTLNGVASNEYTDDDHEPNFEVEGISGKVKMKDADIEGTITGSVFTSKDGKVVVDGISNQIYLKDEDSDDIRAVLSPRKLPLSPSSYFGSSSPTNVPLGSLEKTYSKNSSSVNLITIPAGDSSAYQITIPQFTIYVNVDHPGGGTGGMMHTNSASIEVGIYKGGILQYNVGSVSAMSAGAMEADIRITPLRSFTIQGSGVWSVRVTHRHTINQYPSNSTGNVTNIDGNAIVAKVVNSSAIGSNGMIIATSGTEYTYMVGDTYEVRRGNVGFRITDEGIQKSSNMDSSYPTWNPI